MFDGIFGETTSYDPSTHRLCGCCNRVKELSEFYKDGTNSDGTTKYRRDCKMCYKSTRVQSMKAKGGKKK